MRYIISGIIIFLFATVSCQSPEQKAAKADQEYEVREMLKAAQGMGAPEAREFRREINERLRELRRE